MPGTVLEKSVPLLYAVQMRSGVLWRRHIDQLQEYIGAATTTNNTTHSDEPALSSYNFGGSSHANERVESEQGSDAETDDNNPSPEEPSETSLEVKETLEL